MANTAVSLFSRLWHVFAIAIIVLAIVLQALRLLAPHIDQLKSSVESTIESQLGVDVSIGELNAHWYALIPKLMINDLVVLDSDNREVLTVDYASMQLDLLSSAYHRQLVWRELELHRVNIEVTQSLDGGWRVMNTATVDEEPAAFGLSSISPSSLFLVAKRVNINDAKVTFTFHNKRQLLANIPHILIENDGRFHRLTTLLDIEGRPVFKFLLEGIGDPANADSFSAKAFLHLDAFPIEQLASLFVQAEPIKELLQGKAKGSLANVNLWFDFLSPSDFSVVGNLDVSNDESSALVKANFLDFPLRSDVVGSYSIDKGVEIGLKDLTVDNTQRFNPISLLLHDDKLKVATDFFDIQSWVKWTRSNFVDLPDVDDALKGLNPSGEINNLYVDIDLKDIKQSTIQTNVSNVSTGPWNNIPAFNNISGYIDSNFEDGYIYLQSQQFSLLPEAIYNAPLVFDKASGFVGWKISPATNSIKVYGKDLSVSGDFGEGGGFFLVDSPWVSESRHGQFFLQIGLQDSHTDYYQQFIPKTLPEDLTEWLAKAIKPGEIPGAGFFYRGGFNEEVGRTVQLFADINNGALQFEETWPTISDVQARLVINDDKVLGQINQAAFYPGDMFSGTVTWNEKGNDRLVINAKGNTLAASGLKFLTESPLGEQTDGLFKTWLANEEIDIGFKASFPLLEDGVDPDLSITIDFDNNDITLAEQELSLEKTSGQLSYSNRKGFFSDNLRTSLFGQELSLLFDSPSPDKLLMTGAGRVDIPSLAAWSKQPLSVFATGETAYDIKLTVPLGGDEDQASLLEIQSNLQGLDVLLPEPYLKSQSALAPLKIDIAMAPGMTDYQFSYDSYLLGRILEQENKTVKAKILLGAGLSLPVSEQMNPGLNIKANLKEAHLDQWLAAFDRYPKEDGGEINYPINYEISVDNLQFDDLVLNNLAVTGAREREGWSAIIDSDFAQGAAYLDDDETSPMVVSLDYLRWPPTDNPGAQALPQSTLANKEPSVDPWIDMDLSKVIPVNLSIRQLVYRDKPLGSWSMEIRPDDQGIDVRNIYASVSGLMLTGKQPDLGAYLRWQQATPSNPMSTRFVGTVRGGNPKNLFDQWDLPSNVEAKKMVINNEFSWPGSPVFFAIERLQGQLTLKMEDGAFIQKETENAAGILRLFSLLNFDTWARRIRLDFSDLYKKGVVFDALNAEIQFDDGLISTSQPVTVKAPSSELSLNGDVDYVGQTIDASLKATLPVGGNLTFATALAAGLPAAAGVYIVSKLFKRQVDQLSTIDYQIKGDWENPTMKFTKLDNQNINSDEDDSPIFDEDTADAQ